MRVALVFALIMLTFPLLVRADDLVAPPVCAPNEPHAYCVLIIQRDAAENKLAKVEGENWELRERVGKLDDYLKGYVAGTRWAGDLVPYLVRACAKHVMKPKPM